MRVSRRYLGNSFCAEVGCNYVIACYFAYQAHAIHIVSDPVHATPLRWIHKPGTARILDCATGLYIMCVYKYRYCNVQHFSAGTSSVLQRLPIVCWSLCMGAKADKGRPHYHSHVIQPFIRRRIMDVGCPLKMLSAAADGGNSQMCLLEQRLWKNTQCQLSQFWTCRNLSTPSLCGVHQPRCWKQPRC